MELLLHIVAELWPQQVEDIRKICIKPLTKRLALNQSVLKALWYSFRLPNHCRRARKNQLLAGNQLTGFMPQYSIQQRASQAPGKRDTMPRCGQQVALSFLVQDEEVGTPLHAQNLISRYKWWISLQLLHFS